MGARTTKRDSNGQLTKCPACGKPVRGLKGLKAHAVVCPKQADKQGKAA